MTEFIEVFGGIHIGYIVVVAAALLWVYKLYRSALKVFTKIADEKKKEEEVLDYIESSKAQQALIVEGMLGLLRYRIIRECQKALNDKSVTDDRLEVINDLYTPYEQLGGNGVAKKYVKDVKRLPITK